jgi:hypothetical protein
VDGAGADDDEEAVRRIRVLDYGCGSVAGVEDGGLGDRGLRDLVLEEVGGGEGVVATD